MASFQVSFLVCVLLLGNCCFQVVDLAKQSFIMYDSAWNIEGCPPDVNIQECGWGVFSRTADSLLPVPCELIVLPEHHHRCLGCLWCVYFVLLFFVSSVWSQTQYLSICWRLARIGWCVNVICQSTTDVLLFRERDECGCVKREVLCA